MSEKRPRLVVVLPLEPLEVGESFEVASWPLHITVVPPFVPSVPLENVAELIARVATGHRSFDVVMGAETMFGRREDILVNLVVPHPVLAALHEELGESLRPVARLTSHPERRFSPHVTAKHHARVHEGEAYTLLQVAVVDMAPRAHPGGRVVLAVAPLAKPGMAVHSTT